MVFCKRARKALNRGIYQWVERQFVFVSNNKNIRNQSEFFDYHPLKRNRGCTMMRRDSFDSPWVWDKFVKLSPFIKMNGSKSLKTPFGVSGTFTGVHF